MVWVPNVLWCCLVCVGYATLWLLSRLLERELLRAHGTYAVVIIDKLFAVGMAVHYAANVIARMNGIGIGIGIGIGMDGS